MLPVLVEVVIGVDIHSQTHTAAVLDARTGGILARATVSADPDGYAALVALAKEHSGLRAWVMESRAATAPAWPGTSSAPTNWSSNSTGPKRPARHAGAKPDPINAERAARDALARTRLAVLTGDVGRGVVTKGSE